MTDEKRSRVLGMILGSVSRGHFPQREPVAFLYNGVRLPKLPEYDEEKYPYVVLFISPSQTSLFFFKTYEYVYSGWIGRGIKVYKPDGYLHHKVEGGEWVVDSQDNGLETVSLVFEYLPWANFDLLNEDNTIYLAASDPIPVYE